MQNESQGSSSNSQSASSQPENLATKLLKIISSAGVEQESLKSIQQYLTKKISDAPGAVQVQLGPSFTEDTQKLLTKIAGTQISSACKEVILLDFMQKFISIDEYEPEVTALAIDCYGLLVQVGVSVLDIWNFEFVIVHTDYLKALKDYLTFLRMQALAVDEGACFSELLFNPKAKLPPSIERATAIAIESYPNRFRSKMDEQLQTIYEAHKEDFEDESEDEQEEKLEKNTEEMLAERIYPKGPDIIPLMPQFKAIIYLRQNNILNIVMGLFSNEENSSLGLSEEEMSYFKQVTPFFVSLNAAKLALLYYRRAIQREEYLSPNFFAKIAQQYGSQFGLKDLADFANYILDGVDVNTIEDSALVNLLDCLEYIYQTKLFDGESEDNFRPFGAAIKAMYENKTLTIEKIKALYFSVKGVEAADRRPNSNQQEEELPKLTYEEDEYLPIGGIIRMAEPEVAAMNDFCSVVVHKLKVSLKHLRILLNWPCNIIRNLAPEGKAIVTRVMTEDIQHLFKSNKNLSSADKATIIMNLFSILFPIPLQFPTAYNKEEKNLVRECLSLLIDNDIPVNDIVRYKMVIANIDHLKSFIHFFEFLQRHRFENDVKQYFINLLFKIPVNFPASLNQIVNYVINAYINDIHASDFVSRVSKLEAIIHLNLANILNIVTGLPENRDPTLLAAVTPFLSSLNNARLAELFYARAQVQERTMQCQDFVAIAQKYEHSGEFIRSDKLSGISDLAEFANYFTSNVDIVTMGVAAALTAIEFIYKSEFFKGSADNDFEPYGPLIIEMCRSGRLSLPSLQQLYQAIGTDNAMLAALEALSLEEDAPIEEVSETIAPTPRATRQKRGREEMTGKGCEEKMDVEQSPLRSSANTPFGWGARISNTGSTSTGSPHLRSIHRP